MLLTKQLALLGHEVTGCVDAEAALEKYQQDNFSLIIVAFALPGMNGLEFCHKIQPFPQRAKTVILVNIDREQPEEIQLILEAGANDYLMTPTNRTQLHSRLLVIEQQQRELSEYYSVREQRHSSGESLEYFPERTEPDLIEYAEPESVGIEKMAEEEEPAMQDESKEKDAVSPEQEAQIVETPEVERAFMIRLAPMPLNNALEICEQHFLRDMLVHNNWDKNNTAELLGIPLRILLRKMKKYNIFPREFLQKD